MDNSRCRSKGRQIETMNQLRKLWDQHVFWTRSFIISVAEDLDDLDMVTRRLLRNPDDFADLLRPLYGRQTADTFGNLLTQHLKIGADLVKAAKHNDSEAADEARAKWYSNADSIARFLAMINPYWNEEKWRRMLYSHLQMTEKMAVLRLSKKYEDDIRMFDEIQDQALSMADYMYYGILRQFGLC